MAAYPSCIAPEDMTRKPTRRTPSKRERDVDSGRERKKNGALFASEKFIQPLEESSREGEGRGQKEHANDWKSGCRGESEAGNNKLCYPVSMITINARGFPTSLRIKV